jgi:hypothetical protein
LIADRLPSHASAVVDVWLAAHQSHLKLFYSPRRAPERMPVEYLNNEMKSGVNAEKLPDDKKELRSNRVKSRSWPCYAANSASISSNWR